MSAHDRDCKHGRVGPCVECQLEESHEREAALEARLAAALARVEAAELDGMAGRVESWASDIQAASAEIPEDVRAAAVVYLGDDVMTLENQSDPKCEDCCGAGCYDGETGDGPFTVCACVERHPSRVLARFVQSIGGQK